LNGFSPRFAKARVSLNKHVLCIIVIVESLLRYEAAVLAYLKMEERIPAGVGESIDQALMISPLPRPGIFQPIDVL
jgi:hypothetical protein